MTSGLQEGWWWLGGALGLAVLGANLAWAARHLPDGAARDALSRLTAHPLTPYLWQTVRLLYYVGLPFAALVWGQDAVIGRWLGLQPFALFGAPPDAVGGWLDWVQDAGRAAAQGGAVWLLAEAGRWAYRRAVPSVPPSPLPSPSLREAVYHEAHWAFYRNAPIMTLGVYWGAWAGLLLTAAEAWLNPEWRAGLADVARAPAQLLRAGMAVLSTLLFLTTQNIWLAVLLHWAITARCRD